MSFGPNSLDPRERRAYAHALTAKARQSDAGVDELRAAQEAVAWVGTSNKSQRSGFREALLGATAVGEEVRDIVRVGRQVLDPTITPRQLLMSKPGFYVAESRLTNPEYVADKDGAHIRCVEMRSLHKGALQEFCFRTLELVDYAYSSYPILLPLTHEDIDIAGVIEMGDNFRTFLADVARQIRSTVSV